MNDARVSAGPATDGAPVPMLDLARERASLEPELSGAIERVLASGGFVLGPEVEALERELAEYLGVRHAITLNSGTDALVIGLRALGVEPGDEVVVPAFSFFATAEAIATVGAVPVFVDIDPVTFNLDPGRLEAAVGPRTRAVVPVHLFGLPAPMATIAAIAARHGLVVFEDAAQAIGARYLPGPERCAGCPGDCDADARARLGDYGPGVLGHAAAFSFYPTKNLGAYGDGGLLASNGEEVARIARGLRNHGQVEGQRYHHDRLGYNSRLDALQAAVLRVKLPHLDRWNARRRALAERYREGLGGVPGLTLPCDDPGHVYHQFTVRVPAGRRDALRSGLTAAGIDSAVYYPVTLPTLMVRATGREPGGPFPEAERAAREVLSLPLHPFLESAEVERVIAVLGSLLG